MHVTWLERYSCYVKFLRQLKVIIKTFFILHTTVVTGTLLVVQLVEALRYKPEGRGFDSR